MNAVIYARYSSHNQTEQSIEGQLRDCYAFAEREGLQVVGEYIDRALTGRYDDRPDFQRMVQDSRKHQFDYVIVWKLDRFARNRYDSAIYKHKLKQHGVRVLSAMENIGDGDESIILEAVLEASAEYYSRDLSKKAKRGLRENVVKGLSTGGVIPLGYKSVDKKIVVDEMKAPLVQEIFEKYAAGIPKKQILEDLTEKGIRNNRGKPLTQSSLQVLLKNTKYIGRWTYGGEVVEVDWPSLVEEKVFYQVQERLAQNRHSGAANKSQVDYMLQGKAFCGYCGSRMIGECGHGKQGNVYHYYNCAKRKKSRTCAKKNEKKDFIEWYVVEQTVEYVLSPQRIKEIAARVVEKYDDEFNDGRVKELELRVAKLERDIKKCVDTVIESGSQIVRKQAEERADLLDAQKRDLEIDLCKLRLANGIRYTAEEIETWLRQFCHGDPLDPEFRRRILDVFVNAVYLYDDKVVVFYNIRGGKQVSYIEMLKTTEEPGVQGYLAEGESVRILNAMPHQ